MTQKSIKELLGQAEFQVFERKQSLSLQREGLESLCAMINSDAAQGIVIFGIAPNGELVGVESGNLDTAQRSLTRTMDSKFAPRVQCSMHVAELEEKRFVILSAVRNRDVPYHEFDGRAFIREGTVTRQLVLAEKQSLQRQRNHGLHPGPWKCDRCGSWAGMLMSVEITDKGVRKNYRCKCGGEYWPAT